jgi:hypothetical protein
MPKGTSDYGGDKEDFTKYAREVKWIGKKSRIFVTGKIE